MFLLLGFFFVAMGLIFTTVAVIWQIVVAFRTGETATWGALSILGAFFLMLIPNVLWVVIHWDRGWPMLVTWLGGIPPIIMGLWILYMHLFGIAASGMV